MEDAKFRKNLLGEVVGPNEVFLKRQQVQEKCAMSRSNIYKLMGEGKFPLPQKVSHRSTVWLASDIDIWRSMTTESFFARYGKQILEAKEQAA